MAPGAARRVLKATAAAADRVRRPVPGLTVLIYHRVGRRTPVEVDLPLGLFEEQVASLAARALVVGLDEGLRAVAAGDDGAGPVHGGDGTRVPLVAVTFDDGTADFADLALPVLVRHRVPVTLYVATAFVEEQRPFPDDGVPLSWGALRDAVATGLVDVGSHTHTHALLDRVPDEQAAGELDRSRGLLGERLGVAARHFAYPKAVLGSPGAQRLVRERFASAALAGTRVNRYGATDPYRVARSPIQVSDGRRYFEHKVRGGMGLEDSLRRVVNRARHRGATT